MECCEYGTWQEICISKKWLKWQKSAVPYLLGKDRSLWTDYFCWNVYGQKFEVFDEENNDIIFDVFAFKKSNVLSKGGKSISFYLFQISIGLVYTLHFKIEKNNIDDFN